MFYVECLHGEKYSRALRICGQNGQGKHLKYGIEIGCAVGGLEGLLYDDLSMKTRPDIFQWSDS